MSLIENSPSGGFTPDEHIYINLLKPKYEQLATAQRVKHELNVRVARHNIADFRKMMVEGLPADIAQKIDQEARRQVVEPIKLKELNEKAEVLDEWLTENGVGYVR